MIRAEQKPKMHETGAAELLRTTIGDFPLEQYRLRLGGREWSVLHAGAVLSHEDEARMLVQLVRFIPEHYIALTNQVLEMLQQQMRAAHG